MWRKKLREKVKTGIAWGKTIINLKKMPPKVTINFGRHVCDSTPELCKTVKIKVTYKSESDSFALKTMAGTMTVLLLTLFIIQCLRIERSNGLEISGDNLETNTSNSTHQEFNIKDLNAIEKTGDTAPAFPTPSSALPEMVKKAKVSEYESLSFDDKTLFYFIYIGEFRSLRVIIWVHMIWNACECLYKKIVKMVWKRMKFDALLLIFLIVS